MARSRCKHGAPGPASGSSYAVIQNVENDYDTGYGTGGYTFYDGPQKFYTGAFSQSVSIYIDTTWAAPSNPSVPAFWLDMTPDHSDPNNYGAEHNFRFYVDGSGAVKVAVDGDDPNTNAVANITSSGWYTFEMVFRKAANPGDPVLTDLRVLNSAGNVIGTPQLDRPATSPGGPMASGDLTGHGYAWFTVWQNGFAGNQLAIDNLKTEVLPITGTATVDVADAALHGSNTATAGGFEGTANSSTLSSANFTDDNPGDHTGDFTVTIHWGDGNDTAGTAVYDGDVLGVATYHIAGAHTYADNGSYNISIDVVDDGGSTTTVTGTATVANVAPTIAISGATNVNEGSPYSLTLGAVTDPGMDTVTSYIVHWGDGNSDTYSTAGAKTHTYADGPNTYNITVDLVDEDGTFTDRANAFSVTVDNVAPTIAISGASNVNEGSSYTLTLGAVTDPGADTITSYIVHWGDGNTDTYGTAGAKAHTYADGPNTYNITVDLTDEDGTFTDRANALSVTVDNVAPTIAISGAASVNEGAPYSLTLGTVTDPGADTITSFIVHWGDGNSDTYSTAGVKTHAYADGPNLYNVTVDLVDEDGTYLDRANALSVTIDNVAPALALVGSATASEGIAYTLTLNSSDAGNDTVTSWVVNWGDGSPPQTVTANARTGAAPYLTSTQVQHTYVDGPNDYTISATATDEDGTYAAGNTLSVHVNDVAPTIALTGNATVNEGSTYTLTLGAITDSGPDTVTGYAINWGDGNIELFSGAPVNGSQFTHTYNDGTLPEQIAVSLTNEDGTFDAGTKDISVLNVAPTATLNKTFNSVNEGAANSVSFSGQFDPSSVDTSAGFHYAYDFNNDGVFEVGGATPSYSTGVTSTTQTVPGSFQQTPGTHTVRARIIDKNEGFTDVTVSYTVTNVAPTVSLPATFNAGTGVPFSIGGSFTDPGADQPWTGTVDFGDGTGVQPLAVNSVNKTFTLNHTYAVAGPYTVTVSITDNLGATGTGTTAVTVADTTLQVIDFTQNASGFDIQFNRADQYRRS